MKQRKKRTKKGVPQRITKAVTHIHLGETNPGKLVALDALAQVFLALTQHYTTLFCTDDLPNAFHAPCFPTTLSERWHRVAIQQAAGIAKSWRTNRANAYQSYLAELAEYREHQADGTLEEGTGEPAWREWDVPTLHEICIQANCNVMQLEPSTNSTFHYFLKLTTLDKVYPPLIPLNLASYHVEALTSPKTKKRRPINSSVTLNKRDGAWWLTLSYDEEVAVQTPPDAPVVGIDVGIANFITTSHGRHYGTFHGERRERQTLRRENRLRQAQLRKCPEERCVPKDKLPSTSTATGQRLMRQLRQPLTPPDNPSFKN